MALLPDDELAAIRAEAELALPSVCVIQTPTVVNTKGSVATTYAAAYAAVPCRLAAVGPGAEKVLGAALAAETTHVLTVAFDQAIDAADRVVVDGVTYEVTACPNAAASWRSVKRAYLKRAS